MEEMGSRREEARKRRRRTTWRYRGVCMKVSTRCDIGLPFRPPEVIARRESTLPFPSPIPPLTVERQTRDENRGEIFKIFSRFHYTIDPSLDSWHLSLRREYRMGSATY